MGFRVVIAGGGVAGLEALLALREAAAERIDVTLLAPQEEFAERPLAVAEPFGVAHVRTFSLPEIAREQDARFCHGALTGVDPEGRMAAVADGSELGYDALLVAVGVLAAEALPDAMTFRGPADAPRFKSLLEELEREPASRVAFAIPRDATWPLPLYELALLTAARVDGGPVEIHLVSPEGRPLSLFGARASASVEALLKEAGIVLHLDQAPVAVEEGALVMEAGSRLECDRVVSLPVAEGPDLRGLPRVPPRGLIPVDRYGKVDGLEHVYAAGDVTWFPINQGGIAAQQADAAASAIAAAAGAAVAPQPFRPVLRGALITGRGPRYLRAQVDLGLGPDSSVAARSVLWWPPTKVAGRLLAPYLAAKAGYHSFRETELSDLAPPSGDQGDDLSAGHEDVVAMALSSATANAHWGDFKGALRWLEVAEDLELYLPPAFEAKRIAWQELAEGRG